jgi:hypothetical protein
MRLEGSISRIALRTLHIIGIEERCVLQVAEGEMIVLKIRSSEMIRMSTETQTGTETGKRMVTLHNEKGVGAGVTRKFLIKSLTVEAEAAIVEVILKRSIIVIAKQDLFAGIRSTM